MRAKFLELDVQKKGAISLPEFKAALQQSYRINGPEAERLFATLDTNHDSEISYTELLAAAMDENARKDDSVLRRTFARFDRDEAGEITADDLRTLAGDTFDNAAIAEMMKDADTAGTGGITYEQFVHYVQKDSTELSCSKSAWYGGKKFSLVGALTDAEFEVTEPRPPAPLMPSPVKMDKTPFTSSLMRAAAEAAVSCVRMPESK